MVHVVNKGKNGEREVAKLFVSVMQAVEIDFPEIEPQSERVKRASGLAANRGGCDLVGIPGLSVECKRAEQLQPELWWKQCRRQAGNSAIPVLFYRKNRMKWRVRCYMIMPPPTQWVIAEVSAEAFMKWYENYYRNWLDNRLANN